MNQWFWGVVVLCCAMTTVRAEKPNVVLMLTDNQSYFELGCHGHAVIQTPRTDALARQSVDFANFHTPPYGSPSRGVWVAVSLYSQCP